VPSHSAKRLSCGRFLESLAPFPSWPFENSSLAWSNGALYGEGNILTQVLDMYWRSPESDSLWYKSRRWEKTICFQRSPCPATAPNAFQGDANRFFHVIDMHWRSLESNSVWYNTRQFKKTICSLSSLYPATAPNAFHVCLL